jgi:addiction module HigA family antidote
MPTKKPPHPGDFIRKEIIQGAGLSVTEAAAALKVSRPALSSLLNGKASLSGKMALRIEKAFGVKMDTLMRMQCSYDIARTRKLERKVRIPNVEGIRLKRFKALMKKYAGKATFAGYDDGAREEVQYEEAKVQAASLLDKGFHLGGSIRASRDDWHER